MPSEIVKIFLQYGLLGAITLAAGYWAWRKDREARVTADACQAKLEKQAAEYQVEMTKLADRYILKAESWSDKYHELARELKAMVDAIRRAPG